jgi:hypothetical protein
MIATARSDADANPRLWAPFVWSASQPSPTDCPTRAAAR